MAGALDNMNGWAAFSFVVACLCITIISVHAINARGRQ